MKMNLPNKLTVIRAFLVPVFAFFMIYPVFGEENVDLSRIVSASIFALAAITDFLDGLIARRQGLVTRFGKFMDPLADKFMVFAALFSIMTSEFIYPYGLMIPDKMMADVFFWMSLIVIFRELMVTSLRLVVSSGEQKVVIPANIWGKVKTVSQMLCIITVIIEPIIAVTGGYLSLILMITVAFFTVFSGCTYIKAYWQYIDPSK